MILTTDRYFPWDGTNPEKPDRIWGDLNQETGIPFLVYSEGDREITGAEVIRPKISVKFVYYFLSILLKSWFFGYKKDKRLYLGQSPKKIFRKYLFKLITDRSLFRQLFRWQLAYSSLRCYFDKKELHMLIYHGEFNKWGIAVSWACRDAGVVPVAHQHGLYGPAYQQYNDLHNIKDFIASALLLVSQNQYDIFKNLPVKTYIAGSRRLFFNEHLNTSNLQKEYDFLVIPSGDDDNYFQNEIKKTRYKINVKPHPHRMEGWDDDNIILVDGEIETLILKSETVIATAGFSLIYAIKHHIPIILLNCAASAGNRFIVKKDLPSGLEEAISTDKRLIIDELDYYYRESKKDEYLKILEEIYELETS